METRTDIRKYGIDLNRQDHKYEKMYYLVRRVEAKSSLVIEVPGFVGCLVLAFVFLYFTGKEFKKDPMEVASGLETVYLGGALIFGALTLIFFIEMMASIVTWTHCNSILNNLF